MIATAEKRTGGAQTAEVAALDQAAAPAAGQELRGKILFESVARRPGYDPELKDAVIAAASRGSRK